MSAVAVAAAAVAMAAAVAAAAAAGAGAAAASEHSLDDFLFEWLEGAVVDDDLLPEKPALPFLAFLREEAVSEGRLLLLPPEDARTVNCATGGEDAVQRALERVAGFDMVVAYSSVV